MSRRRNARRTRSSTRTSRTPTLAVLLAVAIGVMVPVPALANHQDLVPETLEGAVCGLVSDLDELLAEFDQQVGEFDDDRLNRALDKGRASVADARTSAAIPNLTVSMRQMKSAMGELEKGADLGVTGSGFAEDLASLGSFFAEAFVVDLIAVVTNLDAADADTIANAMAHFEEGMAERDNSNWASALLEFQRAVRDLDRELTIGPPCTGGG